MLHSHENILSGPCPSCLIFPAMAAFFQRFFPGAPGAVPMIKN
jgi:hypothetical protein